MLIAVAYAHVLLELAGAMLAVAVAARLLLSPARATLSGRAREVRLGGRRRVTLVLERRPAREPDRHPNRTDELDGSPGDVAGRASRRPGSARPSPPRDDDELPRRESEGDEMLEISISSEMAAEHPRFMAECAARGRTVEVFGEAERNANEKLGVRHPPEGSRRSSVYQLADRRLHPPPAP